MLTFEDLADREPRLGCLERLLTNCTPGLPGDDFWCANTFWTRTVKPLLLPLVGHARGMATENAADPDAAADPWRVLGAASLRAAVEDAHRWTRPVETVAEELLRSPAAWDVAVAHLLGLLPACRECGCLRTAEVAA